MGEAPKIRLSEPHQSISIYENGEIRENKYFPTMGGMDFPAYTSETYRKGELPREELESVKTLLEETEEPETREKHLLGYIADFFTPSSKLEAEDTDYRWKGDAPEELKPAVDEIRKLSDEYTSAVK